MPTQEQNGHKMRGKQNHFAKQCRSGKRNTRKSHKPQQSRRKLRPVRQFDEESSSSSDNESTGYCYAVNNTQKHPQSSVSINGQGIKITIDTGSNINVIGKKHNCKTAQH